MVHLTMHLLPFFVPLAAAETLGSWTISALSRQCTPSNAACTYTLTLATPSTPSDQPLQTNQQQQKQQQQQTCTFTITSPNPATQPASHTDFTAIPCHNDNDNPNPNNKDNDKSNNGRYTFNGGWSPHPPFLTLVPTDTSDGSYAFFGYAEGELAGGRVGGVKKAVVYRAGEFGGSSSSFSSSSSSSSSPGGGSEGSEGFERPEGSEGSEGVVDGSGSGSAMGAGVVDKRRGGRDRRGRTRGGMEVVSGGDREMAGSKVEMAGKRDDGEEVRKWQIKGLTRFPNPGVNTTSWHFTIVHAGGRETHCAPTSPTSDPVASFYGIPCGTNDGADFKASWGYNGDSDSAVMTLCYVPDGLDAWFGYDQVSHNQWLGDSKKEPVYYTGCG